MARNISNTEPDRKTPQAAAAQYGDGKLPRRGRPLDAAKHARILKAATEAFLELGFNAASMDRIARKARVSKMTVYSHFTNKEALFGAMIDGLAQQLVARIKRFTLGDLEPEIALRQVGRMYLELALAASSLALHRLVIAEAARIAGLGPLIFANGPAQIVAGLADFLVRQRTLRIADPRLAAEQFFGMVLGHAQLRLLLDADTPDSVRQRIERAVDHAVEIFLNGVAAPAPNGSRRRT
jgi:TetR/AcrR family transcriptional regulator, mexJK operon transcriptional repressor